DLRLAPDVRHARQALSLDEQRGPFRPAVWATPAPGTHASFAQLWFAGVHGDVGDSQDRPRTLSDITLAWMTAEATTAAGLTSGDTPPGGARGPPGPPLPALPARSRPGAGRARGARRPRRRPLGRDRPLPPRGALHARHDGD